MINLAKKRILVTGGNGFFGRYIVKKLKQRGCEHIFAPRSNQFDLRHQTEINKAFEEVRPQIVFHLAAIVGGIGANQSRPGDFFFQNLMIGAQLMETSRISGVEKFISAGTICSYPKNAPVPFREEDLWQGYPEETNAPYGLAKKMLLVQGQAYHQQFNFNAIHLLIVNLYGPGDNFDLETSHVIPAIIRKCLMAIEQGQKEIVLWGDGSPTREFLFVEDAAEGMVTAAERYNEPEPVNLGANFEISIFELATIIAEETGYKGKLVWDTGRPNGQPRRKLDVSRAKKLFGFEAQTNFREGLRTTINWYRSVYPNS